MSDVIGPLTQRDAGFESPTVRQVTVFLDNRVGRLQALLRLLGESDIPVAGFSVEESAECALVRLVLATPDKGVASLKADDFSFSQTDVLAVCLSEKIRHPLPTVCAALLSAEINIHYAYPMLARRGIILSTDDPLLAAQVLIRKGMTLLSETDLGESQNE